jgi:hypothetical protein
MVRTLLLLDALNGGRPDRDEIFALSAHGKDQNLNLSGSHSSQGITEITGVHTGH